jgi:hypothetical protein
MNENNKENLLKVMYEINIKYCKENDISPEVYFDWIIAQFLSFIQDCSEEDIDRLFYELKSFTIYRSI